MCSKVLNGHIILTDTSITTILAPEMTYTPDIMKNTTIVIPAHDIPAFKPSPAFQRLLEKK